VTSDVTSDVASGVNKCFGCAQHRGFGQKCALRTQCPISVRIQSIGVVLRVMSPRERPRYFKPRQLAADRSMHHQGGWVRTWQRGLGQKCALRTQCPISVRIQSIRVVLRVMSPRERPRYFKPRQLASDRSMHHQGGWVRTWWQI
jgi:hypothetical protein